LMVEVRVPAGIRFRRRPREHKPAIAAQSHCGTSARDWKTLDEVVVVPVSDAGQVEERRFPFRDA